MAYLVLVRHGKSEWNKLGLWTGRTDVPLDEDGVQEARETAYKLKNIPFDKIYISSLKRAKQTYDEIKLVLGLHSPEVFTKALDERNYGIYTGKDKWQVKKQVGEREWVKIRRSWDHPIPEGETMKMVYDRIVPFYQIYILADLKQGKNILVVAHGNSLRALEKYLDNLTHEELADLEFGIGEAHVYKIDKEGKVLSKEIRAENPNKGAI